MNGVVSDVVRRQKPIGCNLSLNAEVPLIDVQVGSLIVHGDCDRVERPLNIARHVFAVSERKRIPTGFIGPWIIENHIVPCKPGCPRYRVAQSDQESCRIRVVETSGRDTNRRTAVSGYIPRQS